MHVDPINGVALVLLDIPEDARPKRIATECGVNISPVAPAQVIVFDPTGSDIAYPAVHGCLPDGFHVIGVLNGDGAFPDTVGRLDIRIIFDPHQKSDEPWVLDAHPVIWADGCPICGDLAGAQTDAYEASEIQAELQVVSDWSPKEWEAPTECQPPDDEEEEEEEEEGEGEPRVIDMPRRFIYDDLMSPGDN